VGVYFTMISGFRPNPLRVALDENDGGEREIFGQVRR
jgi:hypothetical protein